MLVWLSRPRICPLVTECRRAIDALLQVYGGQLDILVNNVGSGAIRTFDQLTDEDWEATLQLNFMSYVRTCRKVLPILRQRTGGVIINNASDLARQPEPVPIDYSASKAAVLALTKGLARAEGPTSSGQCGRTRTDLDAILDEARRVSPKPWASFTRCRRKKRWSMR